MTVTREPRVEDPPPEGTAARPATPDERATVDFDDLYHAHFRSLTVQLTAYCGDLAQAQDLVQEAFCRAFARWPRVSRYDDPVAWIRRVAWNLAPPAAGGGCGRPRRGCTGSVRSTCRGPGRTGSR